MRTLVLFFIFASLISCSKKKSKTLIKSIESKSKSDIEFFKNLNGWIFNSYSYKYKKEHIPKTAEMEYLLGFFYAQCGYRDFLIQQISREKNIPSRRINFFHVPYQMGHTATEIKINDQWKFFDSTTGVYFTSKENKILSISEARKLYPNVKAYQAEGKSPIPKNSGWRQKYNYSYKEIPLKTKFIHPVNKKTVIMDLEKTYFDSIMGGGHNKTIFPSKLLIQDKGTIQIGKKDNSIKDIKSFNEINKKRTYTPMFYLIGKDNGISYGHKVSFKNLQGSKIHLKYHFIDNIDFENFKTNLKENIDIKKDGNVLDITFQLHSKEKEFKLSLKDDSRYLIDTIEYLVK